MDYFNAAASLIAMAWFFVCAIMAALGKLELTRDSKWDRACLALLCASVALGGISDFAEALHNILGGN